MATKKRIDNFQGTDPEYIIYLETKVKQLTQACSPPSSPTSVVGDEPIYNPPECAPVPGLRFLPYEPDSLRFVNEFGTPPRSANKPDSLSRLSKRRRKSTARWQNEMDDILCNIPSAKDWPSKRECIGLSSETKLFLAFDTIIGGAIQPTKPAAAESNSLVRFELGDHAIRLVSSYANSVAALNTEKLFTTQIVNFCNLIFVSQCCVLVHHGVEKSRVDDLMKICISQSDPKNLNFLRRGARWANRAISALADDGLGYLASEVFVLCGRTVAQYGRFADAGDNGFRHFRKSVSTSGYDDPELEVHTTLPFWIPFFIKTILGDIYSLSGICNALGYSEHVWVDDYSAWLQIYRARKIPSPRNAIAGYTITLPRDPLGSGVPKEAEVPLPKPTWVCANTDDTQRPKKRGRKSTGPKPKRRRGSKSSRYDSTATVRCADQPQNNIVLASYSNTRVGGEEGAMQVLLTAVEHAVSSGNDQQLVSARSSTEMVDDTTMNSTPAQSEAVDYSLLYAKEIPSTLVVEERDGEPIERRGELLYEASIGMWDHRLGEPLDFDGNLDTEAQHLDVTLDIERHLGMWDHHLGEAPYLEGHVSGALDLQGDLGMWDHRLGEPLDLEGSLNLGDKHVGDVNLDMWDHRLGEPLRLHLEADEESMT